MASALLRSVGFVARQQSRQVYPACGCQHYYVIESNDGGSIIVSDRRWTHDSSKLGQQREYHTSHLKYTPMSYPGSFSRFNIPRVINLNTNHSCQYLHSNAKYRNLSLYEDMLIKRPFHQSAHVLKEETVIEKSLKELKREATKEKLKNKLPVPVNMNQSRLQQITNTGKQWITSCINFFQEHGIRGTPKALWLAFKNMVVFYKDGMILLFKDIRLCVPLLIKYMRHGNSSLTRREYRLLTQTLRDLLLMIPYLPAVLIPFMEFLIPPMVATGIAPSAFISKERTERKLKRKAQMKIESAKLLMESLQNMPLKVKSERQEQASTVKMFSEFMDKVKSAEVMPPIEDIIKFSRLFENSLTLDDLEINQLQGICKLLGIGFLSDVPNARVLRFQIEMRMRELTVDDKFIERDGIDSLTTEELQGANRARGMRALGVSEQRLRIQLEQWLELHLKEQVPTSLLLLSRVMYMDENLSPAEQLKQTISALPDNLVDRTKVTTAESSGEQIDKKTKIKMLDEEAKAIKMEKEAAKKEKEEELLKREEEKKKLEEEQAAEQRKREMAEATLQMMDQQVIVKEVAERLQARQQMDQSRGEELREPETKTADTADTVDSLADVGDKTEVTDQAEPIVEKPAEVVKDAAVELGEDDDITVQDLADIEKAIEDKALHYKDEMAEVAEDLDEYKEDVEEFKTIILDSDQEKQIEETLNAKLLLKRMNKVVKDFDKSITKLQDEKLHIQESIDKQEKDMLELEQDAPREEMLESISEKKSNLISINDVLLSLKQMQKIPDDVRIQKVLEVLDTDHDGLIDINHVLKVTEAVGRENLKLNKSQITAMMNLIQKENELDQAEKMKGKEEKENKDNNKEE